MLAGAVIRLGSRYRISLREPRPLSRFQNLFMNHCSILRHADADASEFGQYSSDFEPSQYYVPRGFTLAVASATNGSSGQ